MPLDVSCVLGLSKALESGVRGKRQLLLIAFVFAVFPAVGAMGAMGVGDFIGGQSVLWLRTTAAVDGDNGGGIVSGGGGGEVKLSRSMSSLEIRLWE